MRSILLYVGLCLANDDVKVKANVGTGEPGRVVGGETDRMVPCIMRREREAAFGGSFCFDNGFTALYFLNKVNEYVFGTLCLRCVPRHRRVFQVYRQICMPAGALTIRGHGNDLDSGEKPSTGK